MTLVASIVFLSALAVSAFVITLTISKAMPRIHEVIEAEYSPQVKIERRINFGPVRYLGTVRPANVVAFPAVAWTGRDYKLAA